jgi:polar amino acid transport system substrate-binding protein
MHRSWRCALLVAVVGVVVVAGCSSDGKDGKAADGARVGCASDGTGLRDGKTITIATASPAVAPWFEDDDPANGKGFESEVGYAVAGEMGLTPDRVTWTRVPEAEALAPGEKDFDVYLGQVAINAARRKDVDLSKPYHELPQALVAPSGSDAGSATTMSQVADLQLGVAAGSDSAAFVADVIGAATPPVAFLDDADAAAGLADGRFDALVVGLDDALRMAGGAVPGTVVVGQFSEDPTRFGFVLQKDSELTSCVDRAVRRLTEAGTFQVLEESYLSSFLDVPGISSS